MKDSFCPTARRSVSCAVRLRKLSKSVASRWERSLCLSSSDLSELLRYDIQGPLGVITAGLFVIWQNLEFFERNFFGLRLLESTSLAAEL